MSELQRRIIYLFMFVVVSIPLLLKVALTPAEMPAAAKMYDMLESAQLKEGEIAFVALDFGPSTKAENEPQAESVIEHLMRKRVPFALFSQTALAEGFLTSIPNRVAEKLNREQPEQTWSYGRDWVNLGFRPGGRLFIQDVAKSDNLVKLFGQDAYGANLGDLAAFKSVRSLHQIKFLYEFTGLVGVFNDYVQFFQREGYVPKFGHGCTSITIPSAYIYLDSGQLSGLLEGVAGAAWYSELLSRANSKREPDSALLVMTALGVAHLAIIALIVIGNCIEFFRNQSPGRSHA